MRGLERLVSIVIAGLLTTGAAAPETKTYQPVTSARLLHPEPENWLMYRGTYDSWGYSPLDQINTKNVGKLVPAWTFSTGVDEGHQSPPIVNNGVMFITTPKNRVLALDAKKGALLWQYRRDLPEDLSQLHPTNGVQYTAVQSGWGVDAQRKQELRDQAFGAKTFVPQGGVLWVFTLAR